MPKKNPNQILTELETWKRRYGEGDAKLRQLLSSLSRATFDDAESLVRLHETVLFLRAYPHNPRVLKLVEQILNTFPQLISRLRAADADLTPLDDPEVSGITGMSVTSNFSYALVRWLVEKYPRATLNRLGVDGKRRSVRRRAAKAYAFARR
jgi:hypothetical protein